jgi:branched-chain amino acid transport system substrate-binding protein
MRKMNRKIALILIPLILASTMAFSTRTFAQPKVRIGIIGPMLLPQWEPGGMWPGAQLAANQINAMGGIDIGGTMYQIELVPANEWAYDQSTGTYNEEKARDSALALAQSNVNFIVGGFRTEVTDDIIEVIMDWNNQTGVTPIPFFINGASTDWLIRNLSDPNLYARYKWLFRINPINSTMLFYNLLGYLGGYLIPRKLAPMCENNTVPFAVICEDLEWTVPIGYYLTRPGALPNAKCVGYYRVGVTPPYDFSSQLADMASKNVHLIIHIFTLPMVRTFIHQWYLSQIKAIPVGIDVPGQLQDHPSGTEYGCEYECGLNFAGTRTPIRPGITDKFWDDFMNFTQAQYGTPAWPLYTAWGAYDAVYAIKELLESADTLDPYVLLPYIENTFRLGLNGKFKYTQWHDVYTVEYGPTWPVGFVRAFVVQWIKKGTDWIMEVVCPIDQTYSKKTRIPPWMYELSDVDLNFDGKINILDIITIGVSFGAAPGAPNWNIEADINGDAKINILDMISVATKFGLQAAEWPLPGNPDP